MIKRLRIAHDCRVLDCLDRLPEDAQVAKFYWKCVICRQWWSVTQYRNSSSAKRVGRMRWETR